MRTSNIFSTSRETQTESMSHRVNYNPNSEAGITPGLAMESLTLQSTKKERQKGIWKRVVRDAKLYVGKIKTSRNERF
jgi:hypothetical protein